MKGKPVDVAPNGDIVFEFHEPSGLKRTKAFPKTHPTVAGALKPRTIDRVDAATFPVVGLVLPLEIDFPDDEIP